jgi:predicted cation transporter
VFVVGVGDGMRPVDEGNKKLVFEKLNTQFVSLVFVISLMRFSFWIVIDVVATLKRRMPWCEVLFT